MPTRVSAIPRLGWLVLRLALSLVMSLAAPAMAGEAAAKKLALGPMIGHTTATTATIWVATTEPLPIEVRLRAPDGTVSSAQGETSQVIELAGRPGRPATRMVVGTVTVKGLHPRVAYAGQVLIDGEALLTVINVVTFPPPGQPARVRLALAADADAGVDHQQWAWQAIVDARPDAMLFLGDNHHLLPGTPNDWEDPTRMAFRHAELRGMASLQLLLRSAPCYALWDERDYGPEGSDKAFPLKGDALRLFKAFWANPAYGSDRSEGIWSTFSIGNVQVFLLDDRYWRDPDEGPRGPERTMLGAVQRAWLERELKASTARIKVVAVGGQMLGEHGSAASFARYPEERAGLLAFLDRERIAGVVFVCGGRRFAELQKLDRPGAYPLYDFATAPLAALPASGALKDENPLRVAGFAKGCNFALVDIDEAAAPATLTFRISDHQGTMVFTQVVKLDELRYPPAK